jgi:hypothetical protein
VNEAQIQAQLDSFDELYPEFQILWGVSIPGHGAGECTASWAWRPSRTDWTAHDPEGNYIYIGHGELLNSLGAIRQAIEGRRDDRVNTCAVFVAPREFLAAEGTPHVDNVWTAPVESVHYWKNKLDWWDGFLHEIDVLVEAGVVVYATLTDIANVFVAAEDMLQFDWDEVPRSDLSMRARSIKSGYPLPN